eukprot:6635820-Prymnesium_polylepis.1
MARSQLFEACRRNCRFSRSRRTTDRRGPQIWVSSKGGYDTVKVDVTQTPDQHYGRGLSFSEKT